jgi:hypothetical protein
MEFNRFLVTQLDWHSCNVFWLLEISMIDFTNSEHIVVEEKLGTYDEKYSN